MIRDPICGPGGCHVFHADAAFCSRCRAPVPPPDAGEPGPSSGFQRLQTDRSLGPIVAWASGGGAVHAMTRTAEGYRAVRLSNDGRAHALGDLPDLDDLVVAPIGTVKGVFLVHPWGVSACVAGQVEQWPAPDGLVITGAAAGGLGELWLAGVDDSGGLSVFSAGRLGWRGEPIRIPGFGGVRDGHLSVAARSSSADAAEVVVQGGGRLAVLSGRAVVALRVQPNAMRETLHVLRRAGGPVLAQGPWSNDGWRLMARTTADGGRTVSILRLDGAAVSAKTVADAEGAVLCGTGRVYAWSANGLQVSEQPGADHWRPLAVDAPVGRVAGACALDRSAVLQGADGRLWLCSGMDLRPLEAVAASDTSADGDAALGLAPPILHDGQVWAARRSTSGGGLLRLALPSSVSSDDVGSRPRAL